MAHRKDLLRVLAVEARKGHGRNGDKLAVLRAGAMLLDSLVGHPEAWEGHGEHYRRVDRWCTAGEQVLEQDNALTIKILPWALSVFNFPDSSDRIESGRYQGLIVPAFIKGDHEATETLDGGGVEILYSPTALFEAWSRERAGRIDTRTESQQALGQQSQALRAREKVIKVEGTSKRFRVLPREYVRVVLDRSKA
jgi:hypothetical protein